VRILSATKKHVFSKGQIGCVGTVATLNVTRGCAGGCVFCYARSYVGAPDPGTVLLYTDLAHQLKHELDTPRRKRPLPTFTVWGSACDPFLGGHQVLAVSRECMEILLDRGIGIALSTRGVIPDDLIALLGRHSRHVQITIPLPSVSEEYTRAWEPATALPRERLFLIQRLMEVGVVPSVRLDPLIPLINDLSDQVSKVFSAIAGLGIRQAQASFLHLRSGVAQLISDEGPTEARRLVLGSFPSYQQGIDSRYDHLPLRQSGASLKRVQSVAKEHGIRLSLCRCHNPGLPAGTCDIEPLELFSDPGRQRSLFEDLD
jgi:DNA repair photolyase